MSPFIKPEDMLVLEHTAVIDSSRDVLASKGPSRLLLKLGAFARAVACQLGTWKEKGIPPSHTF